MLGQKRGCQEDQEILNTVRSPLDMSVDFLYYKQVSQRIRSNGMYLNHMQEKRYKLRIQVFDNYAVTVMIGEDPYTLGLFDTAGG